MMNDLAAEIHEMAKWKGWYDGGRAVPELLMLIVTEVAEAMEGWRDDRMVTEFAPHDAKPEGFPSEMADVVIRVLDLCAFLDIDIEAEIKMKMDYNEMRPRRHGGHGA